MYERDAPFDHDVTALLGDGGALDGRAEPGEGAGQDAGRSDAHVQVVVGEGPADAGGSTRVPWPPTDRSRTSRCRRIARSDHKGDRGVAGIMGMIAVEGLGLSNVRALALASTDVAGVPQSVILAGAAVALVLLAMVAVWFLPAVRRRRRRRTELRRFRRQAALDYQRPSLGQAGLARLSSFEPAPADPEPVADVAPATTESDEATAAPAAAPTQAREPAPEESVTPAVHLSDAKPREDAADAEDVPADPRLVATPPPGYVPLEMPELWEPEPQRPEPVEYPQPSPSPPVEYPQQSQHPQQPVAHQHPPQAPSVQPTMSPAAGAQWESLAFSAPPAPSSPRGYGQISSAPRGRPAPRTLQELRAAGFATRPYDSMREFAVGAVLEGGYDPMGIARLFRFPHWQLLEWVAEAARSGYPQGGSPRGR